MNAKSTKQFIRNNIGALARDCVAMDRPNPPRGMTLFNELVMMCLDGTRMSAMEAREMAILLIRDECVRIVAETK